MIVFVLEVGCRSCCFELRFWIASDCGFEREPDS